MLLATSLRGDPKLWSVAELVINSPVHKQDKVDYIFTINRFV